MTVIYHYVRDRAGTTDQGIRGLNTEAFCRQLDLLCSQLEPVAWAGVSARFRGPAAIPERCSVLTPDDGLADHADVVAPILEMRGRRGVFFVLGRLLEGGGMLAAHQAELANSVTPETRSRVKLRWVDLFCELCEPFFDPDTDLLPGTDEPAEILYELKPA